MDDIIKQIAEAIDDDPAEIDPRRDDSLEAARKRAASGSKAKRMADKKRRLKNMDDFEPAQADPRTGEVEIRATGEYQSQRPDQKQWVKEKLVEFNQIDNLSDLNQFIQTLDLKAQINFKDFDRLVKQRKTLEQAFRTAEHNYKSMLGPEDVGIKPGEYRHDMNKIQSSPELMQAWKILDSARESLRVQIETETNIVDQIKHYLTAGENDVALALKREYETLTQPETEEDLEGFDWDKSKRVSAGHATIDDVPIRPTSPKINTKFPIIKPWRDYFSHSPNEYVFIAYSGLGGQRMVRQIKLREVHERMLDRRLPNLEILEQLDDQDMELLNNGNVQQFREPDHLLAWLKEAKVTFNNKVDKANDPEDLKVAINQFPDLNIKLEQYDETNSDHLADMKATVKDLFEQYAEKYETFTDNLKKHLQGETPQDAALILKLAQKPIIDAVVIPGAPARSKMHLDEEDKYSTSTLTFYTQKNAAEKPYKVLDPWPIGWQTPGQPLTCTYDAIKKGKAGVTPTKAEFTPEEIYTMDLVNILPNFRIANMQIPQAGEEGGDAPELQFYSQDKRYQPGQSSVQFYSNDPGYQPGQELDIGAPVVAPWPTYNKLDPYEKVDYQYQDPITFEPTIANGVTRKEVWESGLMHMPGAAIVGLTEQPDAVAVLNKQDMSVRYLTPQALEKVRNSPRLSPNIIFPKNGELLDDNGQAQTSRVQEEMAKAEGDTFLQYSNLIPPGEAFTDAERSKKSLKWADTKISSESKRRYNQLDRSYSSQYVTALELSQNDEVLPDTLDNFKDRETGKLKSWLEDGYLTTPYGDQLKIKTHGVYSVVDFPVRKFGTEERDIYQNMPLRRAAQLVERLWFDFNFKAGSVAIPQAEGTVLAPVVVDANGFKSVNYPVAEGAGKVTLSLKEALAKIESDLKNLEARGKHKAKRGFCYARLDPDKRGKRKNPAGVPRWACGRPAAHTHYPPTLTGTPYNWELEAGEPVDPAYDGTYKSYMGLCDRHYASAIEIMPRTVLDQMSAWLQDIQDGPMSSATGRRHGGVRRLGDEDFDQDEVVAEIREWTIAFLQAWFGDGSWLNVLGEFIKQSPLSAGRSVKEEGIKLRMLRSMKKLYQDLFSMVASTIAIESSFTDEGVTYQPIDPGNEQNLLTAGLWTEEDYPEDRGVADGMPFLWHAYRAIYAKIYNYYLAQWRRGGHDGDSYTTLPFAQMVAGDIRRKNQLRAALRDQRFPSIGGTPRIRKGNAVLKRGRGEGKMPPNVLKQGLELDHTDLISEAREIDNIIREIGRTML